MRKTSLYVVTVDDTRLHILTRDSILRGANGIVCAAHSGKSADELFDLRTCREYLQCFSTRRAHQFELNPIEATNNLLKLEIRSAERQKIPGPDLNLSVGGRDRAVGLRFLLIPSSRVKYAPLSENDINVGIGAHHAMLAKRYGGRCKKVNWIFDWKLCVKDIGTAVEGGKELWKRKL